MRTYSAGIATAYGSAVRGGYEGTYEEFCEALGQLADVLEEFEGFSVSVTTLAEGSSATASYDNGVLTLGIPKGDTGATGNGIASAVLNADYTLTLTFTDGTSYTTPSIRGAQGEQGIQGVKGDTGNGIASIEKTGTVGLVDTYTITYTDGTTFTFDVTNGQDGEVTNESLAETLEDYALINGYYEEMTVGDAEQLVATQYVEDSEPYLFRTTGGSADVGNREYVDEIVGGTVAWNQLIPIPTSDVSKTQNDVTYTDGRDGSYSILTANTGATAQTSLDIGAVALKQNHIYFVCGSPSTSTADNYFIYSAALGSIISGGKIYKRTSADVSTSLSIIVKNGVTISTAMIFKPQVIDLTAMFGSTIADYIYSLETATAGAGVAWFKKLFPNDYYEYDSGKLIFVSGVSEHKMVGFNQWDEEWEVGSIDASTGNPITAANCIRAKNFIPVLPNTTYFFHTPVTGLVYEYDADKNYIKYDLGSSTLSAYQFTTTPNTRYLKFRTATGYGATYKNDICINLSWSGYRNGEYEEYQKHSYALDSSLTLRGIPKLDSSNNLYYDGDTYASDGTVTRNTILRAYQSGDESLANAITDGTNTVVYSANVSTESATPYNNVQICDDFGTEEFVSTSIVPVGHNTRYPDNLRDKLQHLPSLAGADGYYMISQQNNSMSLELFRIPKAPTEDGTYSLKATVSGGTPTYTWEAVE